MLSLLPAEQEILKQGEVGFWRGLRQGHGSELRRRKKGFLGGSCWWRDAEKSLAALAAVVAAAVVVGRVGPREKGLPAQPICLACFEI